MIPWRCVPECFSFDDASLNFHVNRRLRKTAKKLCLQKNHEAFMQCFGMFIPDPIHDPGSRVKKIPDPGSGSKNLSIFNPKKLFLSSQKIILDVHTRSGSGFFPIPDPRVKKTPDPGSVSATLHSWRLKTVVSPTRQSQSGFVLIAVLLGHLL